MSTDARTRLLAAALVCFEREGMTATSMEDVATEAGLSRATVYRVFPGGRDQLVSETVTWEVGRFLARLGEAVEAEPDLVGRLSAGLRVGHRAIVEHELLQQALRTEPDQLMRELVEAGPLITGVVRGYVREQLDRSVLAAGIDLDEAAGYVTRMLLSYLGSQGRWNLDDPIEVDRLVRTQLLAGIVA
jgi:AcrR family transcriptional regulator